ncbi:unnamed protein product [Brassica oleracea var. botrytis]|uniref:(rape) hypothetical protein n=1 Tax=Brassica napus TaxID=3708 RepID=A0A078HCP4_BRANA|nr:unnamed protein product [Brassica napus]CDY36185.1 BnaC04g37090D [Brassica napus]
MKKEKKTREPVCDESCISHVSLFEISFDSVISSPRLSSPIVRASTTDVQYCEKNAEYGVKVKEVNIAPNPIARGEPATFTISANTWRGITGGKLVIEVTYFGWHIHSETHDLCSETTCPVETGDFLVAHSQVLPGYTPPVSLMIHFVSSFLLFSLKR